MDEWMRWRDGLRHRFRLKSARSVRYEFRNQTCGPSSFATVEIAYEPSSIFSFDRICGWPPHLLASDTKEFDAAMACGVHDALGPTGGPPYDALGVAVKWIAVEQDDVGSSQVAFYMAAWHATRTLRETAEWELVERV